MDTVNDEVQELNSNEIKINSKCDNKTIKLTDCDDNSIIQVNFC